MAPVTYKLVNLIKPKEHEDRYDRNTDFNPFGYGCRANLLLFLVAFCGVTAQNVGTYTDKY